MKKEFSYLDDQKAEILGKLERLRNKKKMPVAKVAALLGKSPSYYSVALNRGRALTVESLVKIAAAFGRKIELRLVRSGRGEFRAVRACVAISVLLQYTYLESGK